MLLLFVVNCRYIGYSLGQNFNFGMAEKAEILPQNHKLFFILLIILFFYKKFPFLGREFCLFCLSFLPFFYLYFFHYFFICIFPPFVYKIQFYFFIIFFPQLIEKNNRKETRKKRPA